MENKTMEQFKTLLSEVKELRNKEKQLVEDFVNSTGELSTVFHYITESALERRYWCFLTIDSCSPHIEKLQKMGFEVSEELNRFNVLYGYRVWWTDL
jgi:hypothetical protein